MQSDPFSAECRAYGRLQEERAEHLAAKAYGYVALFINDQTEEMFKPAMVMTADGVWSGLVDFMNHLQEGPSSTAYAPDIIERPLTEPIYGIVKEWMGADEEHDVARQWAQSPEEQSISATSTDCRDSSRTSMSCTGTASSCETCTRRSGWRAPSWT
jgi:hypothetical protein